MAGAAGTGAGCTTAVAAGVGTRVTTFAAGQTMREQPLQQTRTTAGVAAGFAGVAGSHVAAGVAAASVEPASEQSGAAGVLNTARSFVAASALAARGLTAFAAGAARTVGAATVSVTVGVAARIDGHGHRHFTATLHGDRVRNLVANILADGAGHVHGHAVRNANLNLVRHLHALLERNLFAHGVLFHDGAADRYFLGALDFHHFAHFVRNLLATGFVNHLAHAVRNLLHAVLIHGLVDGVRNFLAAGFANHTASGVGDLLLANGTFLEVVTGLATFAAGSAITVDVATFDPSGNLVRHFLADRTLFHVADGVRNGLPDGLTNVAGDLARNLLANRVRHFLTGRVRHFVANSFVHVLGAGHFFANGSGSPNFADTRLAVVAAIGSRGVAALGVMGCGAAITTQEAEQTATEDLETTTAVGSTRIATGVRTRIGTRITAIGLASSANAGAGGTGRFAAAGLTAT